MGHCAVCILLTLIICVKSLNLMKRAQIHFFVFLDCVSKARGWSDAECALLLKGKAWEASLNSIDFCDYAKIKFAVLKACIKAEV